MKRLLFYINHSYLAWFACLLVLFGMVYSKFLLSIGSLTLIGAAVFNPDFLNFFKKLWIRKDFLAIASIFFLYLISGFWSADTGYFLDRMRMHLPFIGMPVAFLAIKEFESRQLNFLFYFFFLLVLGTSIGSLLIFLSDFEHIAENYGKGQVMPTPVQHIRFSLMVVFAMCIGLDLFSKRFQWRFSQERWLLLGGSIFLVVFLHLFAVRSGLLAFYLVALYYLVRFFIRQKKYREGLVLLGFLGLLSWGSLQVFPTLKNKVGYTFYSLDLFQKKQDIRELSDSRRLGSILAGWALFEESPLLGVGLGDIKNETDNWLAIHYPELTNLGLMPHNQYIFMLASTGILGLTWFVVATFFPLYYRQSWRNPLFVAFHIICFSSFLVEHTLETQVGTAFYIFPLLMMLRSRIRDGSSG